MSNPKLFDWDFVQEGQNDTHLFTDITLRDLFAAAALAGLLNSKDAVDALKKTTRKLPIEFDEVTGIMAYRFADMLLAARDAGEVEG